MHKATFDSLSLTAFQLAFWVSGPRAYQFSPQLINKLDKEPLSFATRIWHLLHQSHSSDGRGDHNALFTIHHSLFADWWSSQHSLDHSSDHRHNNLPPSSFPLDEKTLLSIVTVNQPTSQINSAGRGDRLFASVSSLVRRAKERQKAQLGSRVECRLHHFCISFSSLEAKEEFAVASQDF